LFSRKTFFLAHLLSVQFTNATIFFSPTFLAALSHIGFDPLARFTLIILVVRVVFAATSGSGPLRRGGWIGGRRRGDRMLKRRLITDDRAAPLRGLPSKPRARSCAAVVVGVRKGETFDAKRLGGAVAAVHGVDHRTGTALARTKCIFCALSLKQDHVHTGASFDGVSARIGAETVVLGVSHKICGFVSKKSGVQIVL